MIKGIKCPLCGGEVEFKLPDATPDYQTYFNFNCKDCGKISNLSINNATNYLLYWILEALKK